LKNNQCIQNNNCKKPANEIIKNIINEKKIYCSNKNIQFNFDPDINSHLCYSNVPNNELNRILSNVIDNSIEAISNYGIINIKSKILDSKIIVSISDTGCGISSFDLDLIQNNKPLKSIKGYGLGLADVIRKIKHYNGTFEIYSKQSTGTKIILGFPLITCSA